MRQRHAFTLSLTLTALLAGPSVFAQGLGCKEAVKPDEAAGFENTHAVVLQNALVSDVEFQQSSQKASALTHETFTNYTKRHLTGIDQASPEYAAWTKAIASVDEFTQSPFFSHALSRSLSHLGAKDLETAESALKTLRTRATEKERTDFINLVVNQIEAVGEDAMRLLDRDLVEDAVRKYGVSAEDILKFSTDWEVLRQTNFSQVQVALMDYFKVIPTEDVSRALDFALESGRAATLEENVLSMHLVKGYTVQDLSQNQGPITDRKFRRQITSLKIKAKYKGIYQHMRYPKALSFIFVGSFLPTVGVHVWLHDWNITNTLATLIGGLVTCPPLISQLIVKTTNTPVKIKSWVETLTLKQLIELDEYLAPRPKAVSALNFEEIMPHLKSRIGELRKIRNAR